ncbi:MAG: arsenate reductase family protein [Clostridiales bacterium]|nr:arsenate reductase family protein [Clostridiales bacterium]
MSGTLICYSKCSTCNKAKKWLMEQGIDFEERDIKTERPSKEELEEWVKKSGLPIKKFFNTSGMLYKSMSLKDKLPMMSEEEQIDLLSTDGMLVKRPLWISDQLILVGFKADQWESLK